MGKVVLDSTMRSKLADLRYEIELCDESGTTVGYFVPPEWHRELYAWANTLVSDEELERAAQEPGGRTLAEIMADLEKR